LLGNPYKQVSGELLLIFRQRRIAFNSQVQYGAPSKLDRWDDCNKAFHSNLGIIAATKSLSYGDSSYFNCVARMISGKPSRTPFLLHRKRL